MIVGTHPLSGSVSNFQRQPLEEQTTCLRGSVFGPSGIHRRFIAVRRGNLIQDGHWPPRQSYKVRVGITTWIASPTAVLSRTQTSKSHYDSSHCPVRARHQ